MAKISLLPEAETKPVGNTRPLVMTISSKDQLYSYYMPSLTFGGLFVPAKSFGSVGGLLPTPGSKIMMLLVLLDDPNKKTVTGKVCWISSQASSPTIVAGVGVHFDDNDANRQLRDQIEKQLAGILGRTETRNQTF